MILILLKALLVFLNTVIMKHSIEILMLIQKAGFRVEHHSKGPLECPHIHLYC